MSGVAGGSRILKSNVDRTFADYQRKVLQNIPDFQNAKLTGSAKIKSKDDYGDLDIVVHFKGNDKKAVKKAIIDYVSSMPDRVIVPFQSSLYKGRKYYNSGEIITILYPIVGAEGNIQIDNIIALSTEEYDFKEQFLNLPADKQGILVALAKVLLLEEDYNTVFKKLGIRKVPALEKDQEYEFNLSSNKLTLRVVDVKDSRDVGHIDVWSTTNWPDVEKLFHNYNIYSSFDELLDSVNKQVKQPRSRRRIPGTFQSLVSVKSGEVGTAKEKMKLGAINKIKQAFSGNFVEHYFWESSDAGIIGLYAGGFKPPHKGHFSIVEQLSKQSDKIIIFIGHKLREGETITAEQSKKIWEVYIRHINKPVEILLSKITPVKDIYDWVDTHQNEVSQVLIGGTEGDTKKYDYFVKHKDKYSKVRIMEFGRVGEESDEKISASNIRNNLEYLKSMKWTPEILTTEEKEEIANIIRLKNL